MTEKIIKKEYEKDLVSVVIPTYRRTGVLQKAIKSVLNQTYPRIECIVVNDNIAGDEFSQQLYCLIKEFEGNDKFHFLEQECHINGAAARNFGIRAAKGEYISFLDDDDYWEPEKIELQLDALKHLDNEWGAVSCLTRRYNKGKLEEASIPFSTDNLLMDILCRHVRFGTGSVLIRRSALDDAGYFDETLIRHQDLQLFAELAAKYKIGLVKKYLYNIESSDTQNRPSPEKSIKIKEDYFRSISDIMDGLTEKQRKKVYIMHGFECAYYFFRGGFKKKGILMALKVFRFPSTLRMAISRVCNRIFSRIFRNQLNRIYS